MNQDQARPSADLRAVETSSASDALVASSEESLDAVRDCAAANLRVALNGQNTNQTSAQFLDSPRLRNALHGLCLTAQRHGLHAEQVVIMIKKLWQSLPETSRLAPPIGKSALLSQVITFCIDDFYDNAPRVVSPPRAD